MHKKRTGRGRLLGTVARRTTALFVAGAVLWVLWMTADLRAAGAALSAMGENAGLAMALLAAELGDGVRSGPTAGMTGWERLILAQSALLSGGEEAVAAALTARQEQQPESNVESDPEDAEEELTTSAPETIVEQTLTGGTSDGYVSADGVYLYNYTDYEVDLSTLTIPDLTLGDDGPQILIIHSHTTEAYTPDGTDIYTDTGNSRTTDNYYNMVRVGEEVARILREAGWSVIHDTDYYDYPAYNGAYTRSGASAEAWLAKYPTIRIILDLHRDALVASDGTVYKTSAEIDGEKVAQVMLVVGTDAGGQTHDNWRENLALAVEVQSQLNADWPTLARPMVLRSSRFNQQLTPGAMLVEIGSHGNTLQEALAAARLFAQSLDTVLQGMTADG